ncbi:unnamed protein product [Orchesella dallaii]|uniref:Codanin-1 C-terminal domain-containing protein n=1 Tax=Orchesella dallaii TaxID=48710 RepID=A0ABP1PQI3_9HEXA
MYNKQKERLYEASYNNDDGRKPASSTAATNSYGYPLADPRQLTMRYSESMAKDAEARRSIHYKHSPRSEPLEHSVYYNNSQQYEEEQMNSLVEFRKEPQPESEYSRLREEIEYQLDQQDLPNSSGCYRNNRNYVHNPNLLTLTSKNRGRKVDRSNNICIKTVSPNDVRKCPQSTKNDLQQGGKRKRSPGQQQTIKNKVARVSIGETPNNPSLVSATLFLELSSDRRIKLQEMAEKFSNSLDSNTCKNVLDEVEFLLKLFCTASKNEYVTPEEESDDPLFYNATEQIDFVIKVIIAQLDKLFVNLPKCIIQLIIDNYPHRILQRAKKQVDNWMIAQETTNLLIATMQTPAQANLMEKVPIEKYERASFSNDLDYRAFGRQRDIYYTIRANWAKMLSNEANSDAPPTEVVTVPKNLDSFNAKTRQLFQISCSPTSMFRLASLFISHYLIVERIQEETTVSKDNNVQKGLSPGSKQILEFQRHFLLSSTPIFLQHVVDKLLMEIMEAEESMEAANVIADQSKLCRTIKDTIYLARLLGLALFLPYSTEENKAGSIGMDPAESLRIRNYQGTPMDLMSYLEKALKSGRLISTCPWIIEYLLNCDSVALLLPSYQPVLFMLLFIYKKVLTSSTCHAISTANRNFLRFYFGMLFSSNNFPDSVFTSENLGVSCDSIGVGNTLKETDGRVDMLDGIGRSMIEYFFHSSFNRFRRILGWRSLEFPIGDRAFTGNEFQHILSVIEADNSTTTPSNDESTNPRLQSQLEAVFFESYSPSVKRNVEFIAESVWSNFLIFTKSELLPYFKNLTIHQAIFGEEAAKKCRERLGQEMNKHMPQRCITAVNVCLEQLVPADISQLCWRIALQKAKKNGWNWINSYIKAEMFPKDEKSSIKPLNSAQPTGKLEEDPPAEILRLIHNTSRKIHLRQFFDHKSIDKIFACQNLVNVPSFNPIADLTFALIAFHPKVLGLNRMTKLVSLWKQISPKDPKIINPRNLMLLNKTGFTDDSWFKIGKLTQMLLREGILSPSELEQQCLELSRKCWCDTKEKKWVISEYLTLVMDTFKKKNVEEPSPSTSTQE